MKISILLPLIIFALQSLTTAQTYTYSIFAGQTNAIGTNDGVGTNALFNHPHGICVDSFNEVYVADTFNSCIRMISPQGEVNTIGSLYTVISSFDTNYPVGHPPIYQYFGFTAPISVAVDSNSTIFVSDDDKVCSVTYGVVSFLAINLNHAAGMALDTKGNLFFAERGNNVIKKLDRAGLATTIAGSSGVSGSSNGFGTNALFDQPYGVVIDTNGILYVSESKPNLVFSNVRSINQADYVSNFWTGSMIAAPPGLAIDSADNLYIIAGNTANNLFKIFPDGSSQDYGPIPVPGSVPYNPPAAGIISGIAVDQEGNVFLCDQYHSVIIKATPNFPAFFNGQEALGQGIYYLGFGPYAFGYYNLGSYHFPLFYHEDLGYEYFYDANDGQSGAYLYDFASGTFWYTNPALFPYLYDFTLNAWLYYFPDSSNPGHYTTNPRYFYNFGTSQFITK